MSKKVYQISAVVSILLYSILGFAEEAIEKYLNVMLALGNVSYAQEDFILNISWYKSVLLAVACICVILALISFFYEIKKKK